VPFSGALAPLKASPPWGGLLEAAETADPQAIEAAYRWPWRGAP
jgi:hypothetical protein